jgi:hypothetical protein
MTKEEILKNTNHQIKLTVEDCQIVINILK